MPRKIPFRVIHATSEEDKFPAKDMEIHGPTVKGWQSKRNCSFPQEIIYRLEQPVILSQVQVLAHQYLIPRRLELWLGPQEQQTDEELQEPSALDGLAFDYIGYITLSDNQRSGYKSRELKSISVPSGVQVTAYVKLVLEANHENSLNKYNQVSLVAVQLQGDSPEGPRLEPSPYDDLSFEMYVHLEVAEIIRKLEKKKEDAVQCERFRYAGRLKAAMTALREVGERLGRFEVSKQQAIAAEDYARANRKKEQIELLRQEALHTLGIDDLLEENGRVAANDEGGPEDLLENEIPSTGENIAPPGVYQSPLSPLRYTSPPSQRSSTGVSRSGSFKSNKKSTCERTSYDQYDDRLIAPVQRSHLLDEKALQHSLTPKMNEREKKQAALPISVFGIQLVEKFYSRHYSDKEDGLKGLEKYLKNGDFGEGNKFARATVFLLHRALRDKVFSVYSLACSITEYFFNSFTSFRVSPSEIARSVEKILPELLTKSGDVTPRVHNTAVHTILSIAHAPEPRKLNLIPVHITRPLTSGLHPRLALSRLEIAEQLIIGLGISTEKNSGLTARTLAEFGASGLHHPAEAVRKVAERVLVLVYRVNPRMVRKQLPPDDDITRRNLLYRQLLREFDKIDSEVQGSTEDKDQATTKEDNNDNNTLKRNRLRRSGSVTEADKDKIDKSGYKLRNSASSYHANLPQQESPPSPHRLDKQCIFCYRKSDKFTEEGLNIHYWKYCPMLTRCTKCGEVVEIPSLFWHTQSNCALSAPPTSTLPGDANCPFCFAIFENNDSNWRKHLFEEKICSNHPRANFINKDTQQLLEMLD